MPIKTLNFVTMPLLDHFKLSDGFSPTQSPTSWESSNVPPPFPSLICSSLPTSISALQTDGFHRVERNSLTESRLRPEAQEAYEKLSTLATLITSPAASRADFIQECRSGKLDGVTAIYRTFESFGVTGRIDDELAGILGRNGVGVRFICHNGAFMEAACCLWCMRLGGRGRERERGQVQPGRQTASDVVVLMR